MNSAVKKFTGLTFFITITFFIVIGIVLFSSDSLSDINIESYNATINLDESGNMHVSETWDMTYNEDYRVRFRDIAFQKFPDNYNFPKSINNTATFDSSNVEVSVSRDGIDITDIIDIGYSWRNDYDELGELVRCEPYSDFCESIFIDTGYEGGLSGDLTFEYEYTILGAVSEYKDISELNWVLLEYAESKIKNGTVTINLPTNTSPSEDFYIFGHGISDGDLEKIDNDTIKINFSNMHKSEFLEFRILMPKEIFPDISENNVFINDGINKELILDYQAKLLTYSNIGIKITQAILGLSVVVAIFLLLMLVRNNKKYFTPHETSFKGKYLRELPDDKTPAEMSYVYYLGKNNDEDITATLLDLIRRKIIEIDYESTDLTSDNADFNLTLVEEADTTSLLPHEQHLITWFFRTIGDGKCVTTKQIETYGINDLAQAKRFEEDAKRFKDKIKLSTKNILITDPNLRIYKNKTLRFLLFPLLIILSVAIFSLIYGSVTTITLSNALSYIILVAFSFTYFIYFSVFKTKRSVESMESFVRWDAFKNFLEDFGNFDDYPIPGVIVWEHYLVYAVSLKCADKVMEQLRVKLPMDDITANQSTYLGLGYGRSYFYYGFGLTSMNHTVTNARINAARKITQASSSSSGSGGGFGGGSSFGGGGGGGRSR